MLKLLAGWLCAAGLLTAVPGFAHDGTISGDGIEVQWLDHALVGTIDEKPVFADSLSTEFGIRLALRLDGSTFESTLKKQDGVIRADLNSTGEGQSRATKFEVASIDAEAGLITGTLDGEAFTATVSSDEMDGHHYVNPRFEIKIGDKTHKFAMTNGAACIGCATKIVFTILTVKRHLGIW